MFIIIEFRELLVEGYSSVLKKPFNKLIFLNEKLFMFKRFYTQKKWVLGMSMSLGEIPKPNPLLTKNWV
jgi:hypothetical protein